MIYLTHAETACTEQTQLLDDITYPQKVHWFPETYNRVATGLFYPPHRLAEKVLNPQLMETLRETPSRKTAFLLAGGNEHFAGIPSSPRGSRLTYIYKPLPMTLTQVYAGRIAQACGATDHISTDASACASSMKVLMDVQTLIRFYGFTRVVVLAVEDAVSNLVLEFFGETKASLTKRREEEEGVAPSAFDVLNNSFFVGQGAALAVFESEEGIQMSGFEKLARLDGAYTAAESCPNPLGQTEDGEGFVRAAQGAIEMASADPKNIRVVKTHGTGTASNNKAERAALEYLLKDGFQGTSYKPTIGHTMGASGLLEIALLVRSLRTGVIPHIRNRTEDDRMFLSEPAAYSSGQILALAAGMGNVYSAAVLSMEIA
jgi:3-oxoacyl-[acyl-carrier-protein] synthase II